MDNLTESYEKYLELNNAYLQAASKFFSTSIEVEQKTLLERANALILQHNVVNEFFLRKGVNLWKLTLAKLKIDLNKISEITDWVTKRKQKITEELRLAKSQSKDFPPIRQTQHFFDEMIFLDRVLHYLNGLNIIAVEYNIYMIDEGVMKFQLPKSVKQFKNRQKRAKLWLLLPFVGLALTIFGFVPILSVATGIIGLIMFYLENYLWEGKELKNLKRMPALAQKAQDELLEMQHRLETVIAVKEFVLSIDTSLPQSTIDVIEMTKKDLPVESKVLQEQTSLLASMRAELDSRDWAGIGFALKQEV